MTTPRDPDNEPTDVRGDGGRLPPGLDYDGDGGDGGEDRGGGGAPGARNGTQANGNGHAANGNGHGNGHAANGNGHGPAAAAEGSTSQAMPGEPGEQAAGGQATDKSRQPTGGIAHAVVEGVKGAGRPLLSFFDQLGNHLLLAARALSWLPRRP